LRLGPGGRKYQATTGERNGDPLEGESQGKDTH
jgi:hypothetical protein